MLPAALSTLIPRHKDPLPLLFFGGGDEILGDGSRFNPKVIQFLRDEWVHRQLQEREAEFTEYRPVRLFVGTWNVNGKFPKEDISAWLTDGAESDVYMPDVYVVGLQEMVDLSAANVVINSQGSKRSKEWVALLEGVLNRPHGSGGGKDSDRFELLETRTLVGIFVAVFVKRKYRDFVSSVQGATAGVGIFGIAGNKGAAAIRLRLFDTTFCFVTAHLAAHQNAVAQRNSDYHAINAKIEFKDEGAAAAAAAGGGGGGGSGGGVGGGAGSSSSNSSSSSSSGSSGSGGAEGDLLPSDTAGPSSPAAAHAASTYGLFDHDFLVWLGDFNYRISDSIPLERMFELVGQPVGCSAAEDRAPSAAAMETLRRNDQLNCERASGRVFGGFSEGPLTFRPTYKFQVGTTLYDSRPEKKQRPPAWTDRVLWRASPASARQWRQLYYGSVEACTSSDHKPVHALFEVAVKSTIEENRRRVCADVVRQLVSMENSATPQLSLRLLGGEGEQQGSASSVAMEAAPGSSSPRLLFSGVEYDTPVAAVCVLENTGQVAAPWRLLARPEEQVLCKAWYTVEPSHGLLPPGAAVTLTVTVRVDAATARDLSLGREQAALSLEFGGSRGGGSSSSSSSSAASVSAASAAAATRAAAVAAGLAAGVGVLEEVLVLRAERGKDIFCPLVATVLPSAWGATLAQLARRPEPMRFAPAVAAAAAAAATAAAGAGTAFDATAGSRALDKALEENSSEAASAASASASASYNASRKGRVELSVPKELWRLVDALFSQQLLASPGLFTAQPPAAELRRVRACIDSGSPLPPVGAGGPSPVALAAALLDLLSSLREPLIPVACFPDSSLAGGAGSGAGSSGSGAEAAWWQATRDALPPLHYNVLVYLLRFVREVAAGREGEEREEIAGALSRAVLRRSRHEEAPVHAHHGGGGRSGEGPVLEAGQGLARLPEGGGLLGEATFSDAGTRWEPSDLEGGAMRRVMVYLLQSAALG